MKETWVWYLGWEDPLEEGMATHPSILAWRIPWTEEPGGLQSMGLQRVRHNWSDLARGNLIYSGKLLRSGLEFKIWRVREMPSWQFWGGEQTNHFLNCYRGEWLLGPQSMTARNYILPTTRMCLKENLKVAQQCDCTYCHWTVLVNMVKRVLCYVIFTTIKKYYLIKTTISFWKTKKRKLQVSHEFPAWLTLFSHAGLCPENPVESCLECWLWNCKMMNGGCFATLNLQCF